ncbi:STN and carboxypeptidase regulatory-like domain-containing protein [Dyadobacter alkalitolerans]|uniref:STN and carboxypeptidase regulatory-like domain-containing protein n=1 Tax=Dyadobacter alkalitolerans TaxID=492736 RepID=UPI0004225BA6|nr:STN and carboxypeptidase regulatory-like domain-containing protein [Dyadobacter alkalitolerans]
MAANSFFRYKTSIALAWLLLLAGAATAQELLEKKISLNVTNRPLDETLQKIGDLGGFSFSYSPDMVDVKGRVSIQAKNLSVREILTAIFKDKVSFRERRRYIILQKVEAPKDEKPENFNLNGYIIDNKTGRKLANASIYESATLASAVSNQYGYYKIRLPVSLTAVRLEVRKEDYIGKTISIASREDKYLQIKLNPDTLKPLSGKAARAVSMMDSLHHKVAIPQFEIVSESDFEPDTVTEQVAASRPEFNLARESEKLKTTYRKVQSSFVSAFASAKQAIHTRNIQDTLYRPFQASILPFLGTNHELSGNIINDYSVNLIAGYSLGVNKLEVGSLLNVVRGNVNGFQLAGVSNIVGKDVSGFQYANFLNITLGSIHGFQGTNFINYIGRNLRGFQVAGVGNVVVGTLEGYQLSAGYNYAHTVRSGHQIGLVNYADSSATTPFGIFSYVRTNGYRRYEFSTDEFNYFNAAFKTGVSSFYNIFSLGTNGFANDKPLLTLGYGFGTAQNLGKGWGINADLTANLVLFKDEPLEDVETGLFKASIAVEKKLGRKFALFAGPSVNLLTSKHSGIMDTEKSRGLSPIWLGGRPDDSRKTYGWVGVQAGFRFCN